MQPPGASPSLGRFRQGLWHMAAVAAWELALFNLLLSAPVQEISPQCRLPLQGPSSLGGAGAVGSQGGSGAPALGQRLPGLPWAVGDVVLTSCRSGGVKDVGMSCLP